MRLTNDEINQMAAELLGIEWQEYDNYGIRNPDFIHDANAVRELMLWLMAKSALVYTRTADVFDMNQLKEYRDFSRNRVLTLPPKQITLAVLYAAGKITLEQAREAMEGDDDE